MAKKTVTKKPTKAKTTLPKSKTKRQAKQATPDITIPVDVATEVELDPLPQSSSDVLYKRDGSRKLKVYATSNLRQPLINKPEYDPITGELIGGEYNLVLSSSGAPTYLRCTREVYNSITKVNPIGTSSAASTAYAGKRGHRVVRQQYGTYFLYRDVVDVGDGRQGLSLVNNIIEIENPNFESGFASTLSAVGAPVKTKLYQATFEVEVDTGRVWIRSGLFGVSSVALVAVAERLAGMTEIELAQDLYDGDAGQLGDLYVSGIQALAHKPGRWVVGVRKRSSDSQLDEIVKSGFAVGEQVANAPIAL